MFAQAVTLACRRYAIIQATLMSAYFCLSCYAASFAAFTSFRRSTWAPYASVHLAALPLPPPLRRDKPVVRVLLGLRVGKIRDASVIEQQ
jgi:hypothetical protein